MTTSEILSALPRLATLVVGDVCLDRWCNYDPALADPSRETGIPRTAVVSVEVTPGAAGTVANNLAALGVGRVAVLGAIGQDGHGDELSRALGQRGIDGSLCVRSDEIQTFTYTKIINRSTGIEDQPRIDFINVRPVPAAVERLIIDRLRQSIDAFDVILVSDQAETSQGGVVTPALRNLIAELALKHPEKVILADSRARIEHFRNVIIKPNQQEAETACQSLLGRLDYAELRRQVEAPLMIVTHGSRGVLLLDGQGETWIKTNPVENPVDICGAGDSFAAGTAVALRVTGDAAVAARFGNRVAGITIMKKGTGTASPAEIQGVADLP
ncbi:MAG TPA: PfkB family carbohydrate kinase [Bryobacteraceae bacterium]|nr:PfkB family carbohydrate kinase [Bryobacteraceae bacterium]